MVERAVVAALANTATTAPSTISNEMPIDSAASELTLTHSLILSLEEEASHHHIY